MKRTRYLILIGVVIGLVLPEVASAHEIAGRFEAPLPLELLFGGAALTVAVTALLLAVTVKQVPAVSTGSGLATVSSSVATGVVTASRVVFFTAFVLTLITGFLGKQAAAENFATLFVWPVWLKGIILVSALLGSPWPILSPWRTLYEGLSRIEGEPIAIGGDYPAWLGTWPALFGFLAWIGIVENLTAVPRSPQLTALVVVGYTLVMLVGGATFGLTWFRRADALAVLYCLIGRVAPIQVEAGDDGYRLAFRWPWQGCLRSVDNLVVVVFIIAMVYTVSFDGFVSTPEYQALLFTTRDIFNAGQSVSVGLYLGGFGGFVAVFIAIITATKWLAGAPGPNLSATAVAFAPTILPIAVAYEIAHNYPFVLGNIGQLPATLWIFFGLGHGPAVDLLAWLSLGAYWWSQVLLIAVGHIVAVIAAHLVAVRRYPTVAAARRGHVPLTLLMIAYTVLSLWIISRPIVTG